MNAIDRLLRRAAVRAGAPGGIRYTERQLYFELCRMLLPLHRIPRRPAFTVPALMRYPDFQSALGRHGPLPGLLEPAAPHPRLPGRHTPEPDLFDYGLPRLLVCESDAIAQMLRANGLPMESACPVLSAAELPLDPRVAHMLTLAGQATIYLLHDASAHGLTFPSRCAELTAIPAGVRVVPLGLRPRQAAALHLAHVPAACLADRSLQPSPRRADADPTAVRQDPPAAQRDPVDTGPSVRATQPDPWERAWLRRAQCAEVEAVPPAILLRSVHRLVREVRPAPSALTELRRARTAGFLTWPAA
ncbi:hypothetical protein [Nocardia crassostreae]|uniref:hypothetical protein n=1 Tax=Nocardia crassostreae TaxID=53428 RepID=UPI00082C664F|nr:hypothetical protein [Nocardia crassostreae]